VSSFALHGTLRAIPLLAVALIPVPASAHDFSITEVTVELTADGGYEVWMTVDLDALALGVSPQVDSAEIAAELRAMGPAELAARIESAEETLARRVRIRFDDVKQRPRVSFPELEDPVEDPELPTVLGTTALLAGRIPEDAEQFSFGASRAFRAVHLTLLDRATGTTIRQVLAPSEDSAPYRLEDPHPAEIPRGRVALRYLQLGIAHIVPRGLDHVLFVLGLFLLSTRLASLMWQVTAFTVAHTVSLALSIYGVVSLPPRLVETLIALSIAYVAIENIATSRLRAWRPLLVFVFGLLHGLGFAGVLTELGLPRGEFVTALLAFNVGVEMGQLLVIVLAFLAVGWFRQRDWYRRAVVVPASALIAAFGIWWTIERALG